MRFLNRAAAGSWACTLALSVVADSANAQGGPPMAGPLNEIQQQLQGIQGGVDRIEDTVDELLISNRALCDKPLSWNRKIAGSDRFVVALNGGAFCDLETGLVWSGAPGPQSFPWLDAHAICINLEIDGRKGWSLPTVQELASLIDRATPTGLPSEHPFENVGTDSYWTSTPSAINDPGLTKKAWTVPFGSGAPDIAEINQLRRIWCVRGGQSLGGQILDNPN